MHEELIRALDEDAQGDWDTAHQIVQNLESLEAYWIHAYLHRKEGDISNSKYWYSRAGKEFCKLPLDEEWSVIRDTLA